MSLMKVWGFFTSLMVFSISTYMIITLLAKHFLYLRHMYIHTHWLENLSSASSITLFSLWLCLFSICGGGLLKISHYFHHYSFFTLCYASSLQWFKNKVTFCFFSVFWSSTFHNVSALQTPDLLNCRNPVCFHNDLGTFYHKAVSPQ